MRRQRLDTRKAHGSRLTAIRTAVVLGCVFFIAATAAAMLAYPGGTHLDPSTEGYDFFDNTFSELGRTAGYLGQEKRVSFVLFLLATLVAGVALVAFFAVEAAEARAAGGSRGAARTAVAFGVITGGGFAGIGLTPTDVVPALHYLFVYLAFSAYIPANVALIVAWRNATGADHSRRRIRLRIYGVFFVLLALYLVIILISPAVEPFRVHLLLTSGQKIIVYAALGVVGVVSADGLLRDRLAGRRSPVRTPEVGASRFTRKNAPGYTPSDGSTDE